MEAYQESYGGQRDVAEDWNGEMSLIESEYKKK